MAIPRGLKAPQREYSIPILEAVYELTEGSPVTQTSFWETTNKPESAREKHIISHVLPKITHLLTQIDYARLDSGEETRWQSTVRFEIAKLCEDGLLEHTAWGYYKLTDIGRKRINQAL